MRAGVLISAISHVALVALALLGVPKLFEDVVTRPIEVDLVRAEDIGAPSEQPKADNQVAWDAPPQKTERWPDAAPPAQSQQQSPPQAQPEPGRQQAAAAPPQPPDTSIFDPVNIPALLNLPNAPEKGFDFEATTAANLSKDEIAAFKAHLRKCWKLPEGASPEQATRVVLRIYLRRNGSLTSDPVLIEASASRDGPVVLQTAIRALKDCQPYGFLPADRYSEWRVLDLRLTPRDMAGG